MSANNTVKSSDSRQIHGDLSGVFGTPRSGTTWLGAILDSHPDVAYRFEPFHRLRDHPRIRQAREILDSEHLGDADLARVRALLLPAHPVLEKSPFFPKSYLRFGGQRLVWPLARRFEPLAPLMEALYTPRGLSRLVFKEVGMIPVMRPLVQKSSARIVYLIRHPFAVVSSVLEGQARGLMGTGRQEAIAGILEAHDPALWARFGPRLPEIDAAVKNALLWRFDTEQALRCLEGRENAMQVVYEDLCLHAEERARAIFDFLGLPFHAQTEQFLHESTGGHPRRRGDRLVNRYFSVYRDPLESMNRWRKALSASDRRSIEEVLEDCEIYRTIADQGHWD
jgi:hypothetical protein